MKTSKLTILFLSCYFILYSGCQKIDNVINLEKPNNIKLPSISANSFTSIVATRKDASVEISLTYFDPEFFYKERNYAVYPDHYEVYLSKNTDDNWEMIMTIDTSYINRSFIISGLTNNELYYVYLKEIGNKNGETKNSNVAVFIPSAFKPLYNLILTNYYNNDLYSFDWSSSNNKIVYATTFYEFKPGYAAASVFIPLAGNEPQLVDIFCWFPDFNNDGTKISYSSDKGEVFDGKLMPEHITVYDINTKASVRLTSGYSVNKYPAWSPVSSLIAFSTSDKSDEDLKIALLNPETRTYKVLQTGSDLSQDIISYSQERPTWSADGEYIYYTHRYYTNANMNPGYFDIYRIRSNGGTPEPVFNSNRIECTPAVSPDNSKLAFLTNLNGRLQIWVYDFKDNKFHQPFDTNIYDFSEIWSQIKWKDNNTILFANRYGLYSISVE
jgi:Tol biopolymer transport system component